MNKDSFHRCTVIFYPESQEKSPKPLVCSYKIPPNPACSGHGFAVGEPWGLVGQKSLACRGHGRRRRAADAIVSRYRICPTPAPDNVIVGQ